MLRCKWCGWTRRFLWGFQIITGEELSLSDREKRRKSVSWTNRYGQISHGIGSEIVAAFWQESWSYNQRQTSDCKFGRVPLLIDMEESAKRITNLLVVTLQKGDISLRITETSRSAMVSQLRQRLDRQTC